MYIEGYNFAEDHHQSAFFNSLGCDYVADGNEIGDIWSLEGETNSFVENIHFEYGHFPSPKCRSDVITSQEGQLLFSSQDTLGYAVAYDNGTYRVITATFLFGALIDDFDQNTKVGLMRKYLQFFEGTLAIKDIELKNSKPSGFNLSQNYPNPFYNKTLIKFHLDRSSHQTSLKIYNMLGQEVKELNYFDLHENNHLIWDATNKYNEALPTGTYIYQLQVGEKSISKKMILAR